MVSHFCLVAILETTVTDFKRKAAVTAVHSLAMSDFVGQSNPVGIVLPENIFTAKTGVDPDTLGALPILLVSAIMFAPILMVHEPLTYDFPILSSEKCSLILI